MSVAKPHYLNVNGSKKNGYNKGARSRRVGNWTVEGGRRESEANKQAIKGN